MKLKDIDNNGTLQGYVLVKNCDKKITKSGSGYLDLIISDGENDVVAKIWDFRGTDEDKPPVNNLILVRGTLGNYNGQPQFKIDRWRGINEGDQINLSDYIPSAGFEGEDMFSELRNIAGAFRDEQLKKLTQAVLDTYKEKILTLPAAFKIHHAVRGGLLMHTLSVCKLAQAVSALYPSVDRDLLLCGVILHDIAKSEEFSLAATGLVEGYTVEGTLIGHLVGGAMIVEEIGKQNGISDETRMLVEHMLVSHHGLPEYGVAVRPLMLEAEILSALDTLDANVYALENTLKNTEKGTFTAKIWSMEDRKFYNHGRMPISTDVNFDWKITGGKGD